MRSGSIAFLLLSLFLLPLVSFAQTSDSAEDLQVIVLLREQIRLLEEIIKILSLRFYISAPVEAVSPTVVSDPPLSKFAMQSPSLKIYANGLPDQISIKKGEAVDISWELSNHPWGYCGKSFGWDGALKSVSGSEAVGQPSYDTRFDISCYINGTKYTDSVTIVVAQPAVGPVATSTPLVPAYSLTSGGGMGSCLLEVYPNSATLGKDALEATWAIDSAPRSAHFYWRGKDNGVDIGKVYGGQTQRIRNFSYGAYPAKYERYVEVFLDSNHLIGDPYTPGCTTNTVIFEIKQ